jgi:hypothetical protein
MDREQKMAGQLMSNWEAAKMIGSNLDCVTMAEEYEKSNISTSSTRNEPTEKRMDYLARHGWGFPTDEKCTDMQPTGRQNHV